MANTLLTGVVETLQPEADAEGKLPIYRAIELLEDFDFSETASDALSYLKEHPSHFDVDTEAGIVRLLDTTEGYRTPDYDDENIKKYPIPPRDFQFNGKLIKLMNSMADENTPEDGIFFAQFAKAAKDAGLSEPPHEEKLLAYMRLYPRVFTITVDPVASQRIMVKPIKGFKIYHKDRYQRKDNKFIPKHEGFTRIQREPAAAARTLSLYALSDFAYFEKPIDALKSLAEMAAPREGCFVIEGDVNPYRMFRNKLEFDFSEAIRRELMDSEALFVMSPLGADFPTGFTTPEGVRIFASCEFNKTRNAESYQPWIFTSFYAEEEA